MRSAVWFPSETVMCMKRLCQRALIWPRFTAISRNHKNIPEWHTAAVMQHGLARNR